MSAKKQSYVPVVLLLVVFGLILTFSILGGSRSFMADRHANAVMLFSSFGKLIALLGAVWLLIRSIAGATVSELVPLTLPVIAGVMVSGFHWSGAAALGAIGVAVILRELWSDSGVGARREFRNRGDGGRRKGGERKSSGSSGAQAGPQK